MDLYPLFEQLEATAVGTAVRESLWLFPVVEAVHLLALALLGGAIFVLDLSILGLGLRAPSVAVVEKSTRPWLYLALGVLIATGVTLGLSEALKLLDRSAFWLKMATLAAALVFTFAIKIPAVQRRPDAAVLKLLAIISIGLWLTVAIAGRWIGFS
ncbi:DUF6644 family protein [Phenylobacterium sp.]|jgi:hypothetical protein|uniref:DUF6644 family protein n=1 Tax=Phenylobacterium sp. TaxID=1871053 RepID=UPI002E301A8C|nr:DUF6644 family protein [Phenylobacterium sp.]HEX2559487.1 DUF6644 family protein [Phenylobacterium sp.]